MNYRVLLTFSAQSDLQEIAHFILHDQASKEESLAYIALLETSILSLNHLPNRGAIPRYRLLRLQGYRYMVVESHLVFYKVVEETKQVIIYRILHHRSAYQSIL